MGVPTNYKENLKWYQSAAERGNMDAQHALVQKYQRGQGIQQSTDEAIKFYGLAAAQGNIDPEIFKEHLTNTR